MEPPNDRHDVGLVVVVDRDEDRPRQRQRPVHRDLRLGERHPERVGDAHDLAGRAHLGTEDEIHALQLAEGEHRFLDRHVRLQHVVVEAQVVEGGTGHDGGGQAGERHAGRLGDERNRAGAARVHLQHVHDAALDGVLHVEQTHHPQPLRERPRVPPHLVHLGLGDEVRREHAGRVARVDAGVLDVLHDAADDAAGAVRDGIDVGLEGVLEEAVDEHRVLGRYPRRPGEVAPEGRVVVADLHRAAAEDVRRAHQDRVAYPGGHRDRLVDRERHARRRLGHAELAADGLEAPAVFREVDGLGRGAEDPDALALESPRQPERRLSAELHDHPDRLLDVHDLEHVLERERLEVERVGDVEVGRDRLRIRIDHHRAVTQLPEGHRRTDAAVVELDPLPDAVGAAAEDDDRPVAAGAGLVLFVVAGVQVWRGRGEFARAGVDGLVGRPEAEPVPLGPDLALLHARQVRQLPVRKPQPLHLPQRGPALIVFRRLLGRLTACPPTA